MKKFTTTLLCVMFVLLAFFIYRRFTTHTNSARNAGDTSVYRTIIPNAGNDTQETADGESGGTYSEASDFFTKIQLQPDELAVQFLQFDFNQDGTDDVAAAVKKIGEPALHIVFFELNPLSQSYARIDEAATTIVNAETFTFYDLDVIGERMPALICSGVNENKEQSLQIFLPQMTDNGTVFIPIGDFTADGAITIQRTERSEAYSLGQTYGDSFPVCTQSSNPEAPQSLDQIERLYRWNRENARYELVSVTNIPGKNVEARYLSRLRQGSVTEFESFLSGLWYKPDSAKNNDAQYLQINTEEREIIFFSNNIQEVYRWDVSSPTRLGLYVTTTNKSVSNLRRLIDVKLAGIDEITVRIMEDVKMKITVDSTWNGIYKKLGSTAASQSAEPAPQKSETDKLETTATASWRTADGILLDISGGKYTYGGKYMESGRISKKSIQNTELLLFRNTATQETKAYQYRIEQTTDIETLTLIPVHVFAKSFETAGEPPITFTR